MNDVKIDYLGKEKLVKLILKFSIPCILSLSIGSLYNTVDQIVAGNHLGALGNAAVGIAFPLFIIAQAFAWWIGDGCAAYLNIALGKKNTENVHKAVGSGIILTFICSLLIMALMLLFKEPILYLFGATENTYDYAVSYYTVIIAFFPCCMLSNMLCSVIRADGSPTFALVSMTLGAIVNIVLCPLFVFYLDMETFGAALSTGIGQTVSFVTTIYYFKKSKTFLLTKKSFIFSLKNVLSSLNLGFSSFITQSTIVAISLVCNVMLVKYGAISKFGTDIPIAIITVESKVFTIVVNLVVGMVLGCQPIISYNMGALNIARVKELYKKLLFASLFVGAVSTLLFVFAPKTVIGFFGSPEGLANPELYWEFGVLTFRIFLCSMIFTCFVKMTCIFLQSAGESAKATITSTVRDIILFIPLLVILPTVTQKVEALLFTSPIADTLGALVALCLTFSFFKKINKVNKTIK